MSDKLPSPNEILGRNKLPSPDEILKKKGASQLESEEMYSSSDTYGNQDDQPLESSGDGDLYTYGGIRYKKINNKWYREYNGSFVRLSSGNVAQRENELNTNAKRVAEKVGDRSDKWAGVTEGEAVNKPKYRREDYIDVIQNKEYKSKADTRIVNEEALQMHKEHQAQIVEESKKSAIVDEEVPDIYTGYPGKEGKSYRLMDNHWFETEDPETTYETKLLPGGGTINIPTIKIKFNPYSTEQGWAPITQKNRLLSLNNYFNKEASLDSIDEVFTNFDKTDEKKYNLYKIDNGEWKRLIPGAAEYSTVSDKNAIDALNNRYGKDVKYKAAISPTVKPDKLKFVDINSSLTAKTEEDAVAYLEKKYKDYGFSFYQEGLFNIDRVRVKASNGKEITVNFDEKNPDEALKLRNFLEQNASKITPKISFMIDQKIGNIRKSFNADDSYDISRALPTDNAKTKAEINKYYNSEEYKNIFKSLSFNEMDAEVKSRNTDHRGYGLSDGPVYEIYKKKKEERYNITDQKIKSLYEQLSIAETSGNKVLKKQIKSKIETYLSKEVIQDQVLNYNIHLNDLVSSAKTLTTDIKQYEVLVENFNKTAETMSKEVYESQKKILEDKAESLEIRRDNISTSFNNIDKSQKKINVLAGEYVKSKAKVGSFLGGVANSFLTGIVKIWDTAIIGSMHGYDVAYGVQTYVDPEESKYYKDQGYTDQEIRNISINETTKRQKEALRSAVTGLIGSETTKEYMSSKDVGFFEKALYGVAESAPAMLASFAGPQASFSALASLSYSSVEDEMLDDPDFKGTSAAERSIVAIPYAILMGALENYGLKNAVKGESLTGGLFKGIISRSLKSMPEGFERVALEKVINKEVKSLIGKGIIRIVNGSLAEFETGATQSLVLDIGLKALYNTAKGKKMRDGKIEKLTGGEYFSTPDSFSEGATRVWEDGLMEAIGGMTISTFSTVTTGIMTGNISLYNEEDLKFLNEMSTDKEFKKIIVANLKADILKGKLTRSEAEAELQNMNEFSGMFESIPDNISPEDQIKSINLVAEKIRLTKQREGKDPALVAAQTDRIIEINDELKIISENATKETTDKQQAVPSKVQEEVAPKANIDISEGEAVSVSTPRKLFKARLDRIKENQEGKRRADYTASPEGYVVSLMADKANENDNRGRPIHAGAEVYLNEEEITEIKRIEAKRKSGLINANEKSEALQQVYRDAFKRALDTYEIVEDAEFEIEVEDRRSKYNATTKADAGLAALGTNVVQENKPRKPGYKNTIVKKEESATKSGVTEYKTYAVDENGNEKLIREGGIRTTVGELAAVSQNSSLFYAEDENGDYTILKLDPNTKIKINKTIEGNDSRGNYEQRTSVRLIDGAFNEGAIEGEFLTTKDIFSTPIYKTNTTTTNEKVDQVNTYRAEEQAELLEAIPKIESYKVNGEIDKTLMPKNVLAKYNKIYNKYDKLISPLLETKSEATTAKTETKKTEYKQNLVTPENSREIASKQNTPLRQKIAKSAAMIMRALPGVKIYLHNNQSEVHQALANSTGQSLDKVSKEIGNSAGSHVKGEIHINMENANETTMLHEAFHEAILRSGKSIKTIIDFANGLKNIISDKAIKAKLEEFASRYNMNINEREEAIKLENKKRIADGRVAMNEKESDNYISSLEEPTKSDEFLTELGAIMAEAETELTTTKLQQFLNLINRIAKSLGLPVIIKSSATAQEAVDFINSMARSLRTGEAIEGDNKGDGKIKKQVEKLFLEETPKFKSLDDVSKYIQSWVNENKLFDKSIENVSDQEVVNKFAEHVLNEIRAWESIKGSEYVGFYNEDIPQRLNPELQKFAKQRYGRELTGEEVSLYHMVSAFASPSADPNFDSSKGLEVFDKYMMTGDLTAYGTDQATIWDTDAKGKRYDTGKLKFDDKGNPVYKQVAKAYATTSLEKFNNIVNNFNGDISKAVNWVLSNHSFDDASKMMGKPITGAKINQLDENEYFTKENGGTGVFAITGAKLGSYILNRVGDYSTVTKDMWYARTLARLAGESLTEKGKAIKSPWASNTKQGLRKRKLADKAFEIVAKELGTSPADVQQKIWDFEKRLYEKLGAVEKSSYASEGLKSKAKQILSEQPSKIKQQKTGVEGEISQEDGKNIFYPKESLGLKRSEMPQIRTRFLPILFDKLKNDKISFEDIDGVMANTLKPSQNEINIDNTDKFKKDVPYSKKVIVSSDNYIIDGHHRWYYSSMNDLPIDITKIDLPIQEALSYIGKLDFIEQDEIGKIKQQKAIKSEPVVGNKLFNEPLKEAGDIAESYMKSIGKEYVPVEKITKLDEGLSKRISDAYDQMKNDPTDPKVKAAYEAMSKETLDQYDAILSKGYKVEINNNEPYSSSDDMIKDLRDNRKMNIFSTESGFGDEAITDKQRKENVLLRDSGRKDANGKVLLVNDVFRFVHDFFGHAKLGNSFGPIGEENAWRVHSEMYSPEAKKAMTSETRGQNSFVNFSGVNDAVFKKRDKARELRKEGKIDQANQMVEEVYEEMKFADQKVGLLPNFAIEEGSPSKIKLQKTPQETRMDKESEDVFKKSLDRGTNWAKATQNALDYIQKSKWYQEATDIEREQKVRDFKQSKNQKLKKAPSVAKVLGKPKPNMVTVNEAAAFKDQLRLEAKAAREAKADLNSKRKSLSDAIKGMVKLGKLKVSQASTIIKRVSQVNLDNPVMVDRLIDYAAKVFERADYQERLDNAFSYRRAIKKLLKSDNQAQVVGMANEFAKIDPSMVENIDDYIAMAEIVKNAVSPSKIKGLDVVLKESANIEAVSNFSKDALEKQEQQLKAELLAINNDLLQSGVISGNMTIKEIQEILNAIKDPEYKMDSQEKERYIRSYLSKRFESLASIVTEIINTNQNPLTGEKVAITVKDRAIISDLLDVDMSEMSIRDAIFAVEAMDNFVNNGITSKLEGALSAYKGQLGLKEQIKSGKVARALRLYFSKKIGRYFATEFTPLPLMMERMFSGVKSGISVMKSMGLDLVINGVNKANYLHNKIINEYYEKFIKNSKTFHNPENIYERGMLSFLKRNVTGSLEEMKAETSRRIKMIEESIATLMNDGDESQKAMAEIYQKVFDKLDVSSGDIDVIDSRASKENRDAVDWWVSEWSKHYQDLHDVSLSVYNYDLGSDINYTPDRYKTIKTESFDQALTERNSSFLINMDHMTDKSQTGVLMQANRPKVMPEGRYISLDFDTNNSSSLKGALVDINTAAGIRQVDGFLNSKLLSKLIPVSEDRSVLIQRTNRYIRRAKGKIFIPTDLYKDVDAVLNFAASLGVGKALGGVLQSVKQTIPIAISTAINTGKFNMSNFEFNEWLNKAGMPISNRGIESLSTIESMDRRMEAKGTKVRDSLKWIQEKQQLYVKWFLSKPDVFIARSGFQSYYLQYMGESSIDWANHEPNQDALNYAQAMVDRQQNISDPMLGGEFLTAEDGMKRMAKKILFPFASFGLNQKARLYSDIINMGSKTTSTEDRKIATKSAAATIAEMLAYRAISVGIGYGFYKAAAAIISGFIGDDDDDDKENSLKWLLSATKFPLKSMVNDIVSPIQMTDRYVTMSTDYLLSLTTGDTEAELDELVKQENEIRSLKDQDPMTERQEEKFRQESKNKSLYQVGSKYDDNAGLGMISIASDLYKKIYDDYTLATTGEFQDDYKGNVTIKRIRPVEQDLMKNTLYFSALFAMGILPKESDQMVTKVVSMIKKNAMSESEYEKYEDFKKEFKREPSPFEMGLIKSEKKYDYISKDIDWVNRGGGLNLSQGREYVKLLNIMGEVNGSALLEIKAGKTADQISKSMRAKL